MSHGGVHPSPCLTTADVLHLGGSPWSRTRGRYSSSGNSSALAGDLRLGGPSPSGAVLTPPLTWFGPPAEAVCRGMAHGATCERFRGWMKTNDACPPKGAACQTSKEVPLPRAPYTPMPSSSGTGKFMGVD